jgi:chromate transporter
MPMAGALRELCLTFLKLGTIGFGGPAAHIALMEQEAVRRRRWLTREHFLDLVGATNLIPGPNSTELAIHLGRLRGGGPGLVTAGVSFILPAFSIVCVIAWSYRHFGALPQTAWLLRGVQPVMIAIVVQALAGLARSAIKSAFLALIGAACLAVAAIRPGNEILLLLAAGAIAGITAWSRSRNAHGPSAFAVLPLTAAVQWSLSQAATIPGPLTLSGLFFVFAKAGSVLFGSGYVLLALLRADLVQRLGWLSDRQLLDAIVVGQITPGPVFTTATFIGYVLAGMPGAIAATLGIFLPAFVFVAISAPIVPRLRRSALAGGVLDGVNVASLALMANVTWQLGRTALVDGPTIAIAVASACLLAWRGVNSLWLVIAGAIIGLLDGTLHG